MYNNKYIVTFKSDQGCVLLDTEGKTNLFFLSCQQI